MTPTGRHAAGAPSGRFRRAIMRALRIPAILGMAAAVAGAATLTDAGQARAQADPCREYVVVFKTTSNGSVTGPGTTTLDPAGFSTDLRDPVLHWVGMGGVVLPHTSATIHYRDMSGAEVRTRTTAQSDGGGVIRQDNIQNIMFWDVSDGSQRIQVFADFHTRCGGNDVVRSNVFAGTITTFPTPPVRLNPKYLVIGVGYAPPGPSSVDYGDSTSLASKLSLSSSLQTGVNVTTTETLNQSMPISTSSSFSQRFQDTRSNTVEKTTTNDIIIPGPANSLDGIDHRRDRIFVLLNPTFRISADSATSLLLSPLDVDPRDPVPVDIVQLSVLELQTRSFNPGDASRLQRSWSPSGALTDADFDSIVARDPFAGGATTIDPERFDPLPDGFFNYTPADPGGQPITQRRTIRFAAGTTVSGSATFTAGVKFDTGTNQTETMRDEAGVVFDTLKTEVKTTHTLDVTASISVDSTTTNTETTTISLTGPVAGYQGPTALRAYRDKLYRTIMFAFDPVATFEVVAPSPNQTVTQGGGAAFPISTQSDFGFQDPVSFDASVVGLPAGAQASFSPASVTPPGGTTLNVTTTAQTPAGTYPLTITARSGLIVRHVTVSLVVNALPFTLSATPSSRTVSSGQSTTYTVTVNAAGGFGGPVQLSGPDGLPPGASASFSPTTINGSGSATLTVATSAGTPAGTSSLTIRAAGGGITRTAAVSLVVDNTQEFDMAVTPQAAGVFAGDTALYTITTTAINGFAGSVSLAVSGQPAGTTAAFSVNPIAGAGTSTLGIATTTATTPGNYLLTITGTSGGLSHGQTVTLTVSPPRPDFTLAATPSTASVPQGGATTYSVSTAAVAGFSGGIGLSVSGLPAGATAGFSATPVSPGSGSTLTVSAGPSTPAGTYQLAIVGASGSLSHGQVVTLTVTAPAPDFTVAATPSSRSASQGGSTTFAISTAPVAGFTGGIDLGVTGLPAGVTASYSPDPVSAGSGATLTVSVGATAAPGNYSLTITGAGGGRSHSQVVSLSVTAAPSADFALTVDPTAMSVARGASGAGWVQTTSVGGASDSPIDLSVSGLPAGVTVAFDATEITVDSGVNMYPVVAASTAPGTYTITITGIGGSRTHSQQVTLTVT